MAKDKELNALEDLQGVTFDEGELEEDRSGYRNYLKGIAIIIGYLLGVKEEYLKIIADNETLFGELKETLEKNDAAIVVRYLNNIRSNLMLQFKAVSRTIRVTSPDYKPIYQIEIFTEDFKALKKLGMDITTGRSDLNEYLQKINDEILKRMDGIKPLFPEWVEFRHIRFAFNMPMAKVKTESEKFQANQSCYPYKRYFHWRQPTQCGNVLLYDEKILSILYENDGAYFTESARVIDVSEKVKDSINEFIRLGRKVQIFIDGENTDPYRFAAAIDSLSDEELEKIDRIVIYYDAKYTTRAWEMLKHFVCGITVEAVAVERLLEEKSLVDHKLVAGVSRAVYAEQVDSVILCSSDSDFWSVIEDVRANYLVMIEADKCGTDFKEVLREHDIFYCYLDRFQMPADNTFFKMVFRKEMQKQLDEAFCGLEINVKSLFYKALE